MQKRNYVIIFLLLALFAVIVYFAVKPVKGAVDNALTKVVGPTVVNALDTARLQIVNAPFYQRYEWQILGVMFGSVGVFIGWVLFSSTNWFKERSIVQSAMQRSSALPGLTHTVQTQPQEPQRQAVSVPTPTVTKEPEPAPVEEVKSE